MKQVVYEGVTYDTPVKDGCVGCAAANNITLCNSLSNIFSCSRDNIIFIKKEIPEPTYTLEQVKLCVDFYLNCTTHGLTKKN